MRRVWLSAVLVLSLLQGSFAQQQAADDCLFAGRRAPCAVETHIEGDLTVTLKPLDPSDWEFLERDLAPDATALHAELLNHTTWANAQRYALAQIYRQYRAMQAMKLATYARFQIMQQMRAKYGDLDELALIEAVVLEAGLPVIQVPSAMDALPAEALNLGASRKGRATHAK